MPLRAPVVRRETVVGRSWISTFPGVDTSRGPTPVCCAFALAPRRAPQDDAYVLVSRYDQESSAASKVGVPTTGGAGAAATVGSPPRDGYAAGSPWREAASGGVGGAGITLAEFKAAITPVLDEYFECEDVAECQRSVTELNAPFFHFELVKRAMTMSMDKRDRERELTSKLLSALYGKTLTMEQIGKGFERLFELYTELVKDIPDAVKLIAQFLARAVVDEVLPPSFLSDPLVERIGKEVIEKAKVLLSMKHGTARLEHVWGPGASPASVEELKKAVAMLVQEFLLSGDKEEAARCVHELGVPHFHHEVVKRTIVLAMDKDDAKQAQASELLALLYIRGQVSQAQLVQGFARVRDNLSDLSLDAPTAPAVFAAFVSRGQGAEFLPADFSAAAPPRAGAA